MSEIGAEAGTPLFTLPEELAIDTDVARRVIAAFIAGLKGTERW